MPDGMASLLSRFNAVVFALLLGMVVLGAVDWLHRVALQKSMIDSFGDVFEGVSDKKGRYARDGGPERLESLESKVDLIMKTLDLETPSGGRDGQ